MLFHPFTVEVTKVKKAILLGLLMLVSVGMVFAANASGVSQHILQFRQSIAIDAEKAENLRAPEQVEGWKIKAIEIAMEDPQVQEILETADYYHINAFAIYELREYESERGKGFALTVKEGVAKVEIKDFKEYDEEIGVKIYEAILDLTEETVTEITEHPETLVPKDRFESSEAPAPTPDEEDEEIPWRED